MNPPQKLTPKHQDFLARFHSAYIALQDQAEFQFIEQLERDQLEDLKTHATSVSINDPHYERRNTYMAGMVAGMRRWIDQKKAYIEQYRKLQFTQPGGPNGRRTSP